MSLSWHIFQTIRELYETGSMVIVGSNVGSAKKMVSVNNKSNNITRMWRNFC
jgi:hypothetical protein